MHCRLGPDVNSVRQVWPAGMVDLAAVPTTPFGLGLYLGFRSQVGQGNTHAMRATANGRLDG